MPDSIDVRRLHDDLDALAAEKDAALRDAARLARQHHELEARAHAAERERDAHATLLREHAVRPLPMDETHAIFGRLLANLGYRAL